MRSDTRSSATNMLFLLVLMFFSAAIGLSYMHAVPAVLDRAWGAFEAVLGALLLILKTDAERPPNPTLPPGDPAPK